MKNDRGNRKQFLGSGAASGATPGGYQGKFNATMFGQTLLNKMQKENTTSTSQMFQPGSFAKYIGDGASTSDKPDPQQLPFGQKDNNGFKATFGSPSTNIPSFMSKPNTYSGGVSNKSGSSGIDKEGGPLSETGSNA